MFSRKSVVSLLACVGVSGALCAEVEVAAQPETGVIAAVQQNVPTQQSLPQAPQQQQSSMAYQAQSGKVQWLTNYQEAVQQAKSEKKPLFLFFTGSDWCGWCKKMESEILASSDFTSVAANKFVFVMLDFPMNQVLPPDVAEQNAQLKQKYGVTGYPTVILLDSNENFIAETGYRSGGGKAYADYLFGLIH